MNEELKKRLTTGLPLFAAVGLVLLWGNYFCTGRWVLMLMGLAIALVGSWEFARLCTVKDQDTPAERYRKLLYAAIPALAPLLLFVTLALNGICGGSFCTGVLLVAIPSSLAAAYAVALFSQVILGRNSLETARTVSSEVFPALWFIGFNSCFLIALAASAGAVGSLVWLIVVVCINDICAYFIGSAVGKQKIALALSPGKTYAGSVGGLAGGLVAGLLLKGLMNAEVGLVFVLFTVFIVLVAQAGDLGKSYFKRLYGEKDSGSLFPGHGGMLDRMDAALAAAPFVYLWFFAFVR